MCADSSKGSVFRIFDPHGSTIRLSTLRMVHQLVREDFPTCRCWRDGDGWAMNVEVRNIAAEDEVRPTPFFLQKKVKTTDHFNQMKAASQTTTKEALGRQIGRYCDFIRPR